MTSVEPDTRQAPDDVRRGTRRLLVAFAVLTALAVNQLLVLADVTDRYWVWAIHTELTAAFLGAAYAAGLVLSLLSLRERSWARIRIPVITVTVFTVLTAVATLVHNHKLLLTSGGAVARLAAWVWLAVYLVIPVVCLLVVLRQERGRPLPGPARRLMPDWLTVALAAEGAVLLTAGAMLFAGGLTVHHHVMPMTRFWPWDIMPLSAQVIGAWLLALALAAALAIGDGDLSRLRIPGVTYTVFGVLQLVVVIWHRSFVEADDPWLWGYVGLLLAITATGAYGWWVALPHRSGRTARAGAAESSSLGSEVPTG
ncbi:hypothetical protein [Blastococcus sp. PRF04-17]|uniref:hypothetical protein n=1 Tax=Blastococcus sp. PRF04-17 TaxID=2933797 RepID=UPI001FF6EEDB|nr:hypothetical protein [Blastococcus sp. PRF04-17]UOY02379.1 hypothetical protein MVA48_03050 [Blastococcus sp. PRF04-17]